MKWFLFILAGFSLIFTSCSNYSAKEIDAFDQQITAYLDSSGITMEKTEDGLYYHILKEGEGDENIKYNSEVTFYYKGSFLNGNSFQVIDKNEPLTFKVNQLIIGWQDALMLVKKGGEIRVIIPPQLAYGKKHTSMIPQNSILVYDIFVVDYR